MKLTRLGLCALMVGSLAVFGCGSSGGNDGGNGEDAGDAGEDGGVVEGCGFGTVASNAFRADQVSIDAPGLFLNAPGPDGGVVCASDLTTLANNLINTAVCTDAADDEDTLLDLTLILYFSEFSSEGAGGTFGPAECEDAAAGAALSCEPGETEPAEVSLTTSDTDCSLTLGSQTVDAAAGTDGCFTGEVAGGELLLNLGTVSIPVVAAQMLGSFEGSPATAASGSLLGFVTLEDAENTTLPEDLPSPIGGSPLIDLLRGPDCDPSDVETVDLGGELGETDGFVFVMGVDMIGVNFDTGGDGGSI